MECINSDIVNGVICDSEGLSTGQLDSYTISKAIGFAGDVRNGVTIDGNNGIIARLYIDTTLAIGNSVAVYLKACHVALSKNSISAGFVSGKCAVLDCHIAVSSRVRHSETSFKFAVFESQGRSLRNKINLCRERPMCRSVFPYANDGLISAIKRHKRPAVKIISEQREIIVIKQNAYAL